MAIGPLQIFLILMIIILLFGTKKLRNVGSDLGGAIKNFKKSVKDGGQDDSTEAEGTPPQIEENKGETMDAQFEEKKEEDSK
ncbi:MAG: twin-arginine translocase TatA/TatE family subunit [Gammaproteobacteria bacterium]|nr:twin-arginine translocase TatA/TatE family subunit [Gammaproteobacteria bacterium]